MPARKPEQSAWFRLKSVLVPFCTLAEAGKKLGEALEDVTIQPITIPYLTNVTADYVKDPADVKDYLVRQVSSSVRWQQTIERLIADGAEEFVEIEWDAAFPDL